MEYLLGFLILGIVWGCAIGAYELLDAIERDEEQDATGAVEHARAVVLDPAPSTSPQVSAPQPSAQLWRHASPHGRGSGSGEADDADKWAGRIRGLEERLDRLERDCLRIEAFAREKAALRTRTGTTS
jgi:hypothetical protein